MVDVSLESVLRIRVSLLIECRLQMCPVTNVFKHNILKRFDTIKQNVKRGEHGLFIDT